MARRSARAWGARLAAPAAFLLAVTVAVLLVRSALREPDDGGSRTVSVTTRATTTSAAATTKTTTRRNQPATPRARYYLIESGDTFGTVAAKFGTTVAALQTLNPDVSSNALVIGQRIRVR